jgi:hypothetical protein
MQTCAEKFILPVSLILVLMAGGKSLQQRIIRISLGSAQWIHGIMRRQLPALVELRSGGIAIILLGRKLQELGFITSMDAPEEV